MLPNKKGGAKVSDKKTLRASLLSGVASTIILFGAGAANAQQAEFNISPQPLSASTPANTG